MSNAYNHANRMGDVYYLHSRSGKSGQLTYGFARKLTGTPVEAVPAGYEVREHPESGQITLRRIRPSPIRPEEKQLLEEMIHERAKGVLTIVDVDDRSLIVYASDMDAEARINILRQMAPMDEETARQMQAHMLANYRYTKMMRFTLVDAEHRHFSMDRWCFSGSIDDWYSIEGDAPLAALAGKYIGHLGQESFFDLM